MDEKDLIRRAKNGDPGAFEQLVRLYQNRAYSFVYAHTRNREDTRDIVQEVFMSLYAHIGRIDENRNFFSYFYKTVQNRVVSHFRKNGRNRLVGEDHVPDDLRDWTDSHLSLEEKIFLLDTLDTLPADEKNLMILRYFEGFNDRELSETTGLTEDHVRVKIHRARKKMLKSVEAAYD